MSLSYREPSLIPPDEQEPDDPILEESEHLKRKLYKDGHVEWERKGHDLDGYDQDCYEEAYELGQKSMDEQLKNMRAYSRGAFDAAQAIAGKGAR